MTVRFTLPETHAAFAEWSRLTGCGWDSLEWGEVLAALESCDLLAADRLPQHGLFDPPDLSLGDAPQVQRLRAAIVGSARLHSSGWGHDLATSALIVAAVLDRFYPDRVLPPFDDLMESLTAALPARVHGLAATPSEALTGLLGADALAGVVRHYASDLPVLLRVVMDEAQADDRFAERVFDRLASASVWGVVLLALGDGRCLLYRTR